MCIAQLIWFWKNLIKQTFELKSRCIIRYLGKSELNLRQNYEIILLKLLIDAYEITCYLVSEKQLNLIADVKRSPF